jgi:F-type H+-transporting ATPase subunit gamma
VAAAVQTQEGEAPHPLLETHSDHKRVLVLVLTSDRGLCGGFNSNTLRMAERFIKENKEDHDIFEVATMGRRGADYFRKRKYEPLRNFPNAFADLSFRRAQEISKTLVEQYCKHDLDAVYILFNEYKSVVSQVLRALKVLPIDQAALPQGTTAPDYIYEQDMTSVLNRLLPTYVAIDVWRALLESWASEQGARMSAMDNASKNASEMINALTLQYNRARQAAITKELMEIIAGAEALKG